MSYFKNFKIENQFLGAEEREQEVYYYENSDFLLATVKLLQQDVCTSRWCKSAQPCNPFSILALTSYLIL